MLQLKQHVCRRAQLTDSRYNSPLKKVLYIFGKMQLKGVLVFAFVFSVFVLIFAFVFSVFSSLLEKLLVSLQCKSSINLGKQQKGNIAINKNIILYIVSYLGILNKYLCGLKTTRIFKKNMQCLHFFKHIFLCFSK